MKTLLMFAGQGSQYHGMGIDLLDTYPELMKYVDEASEIVSKNVLDMFHDEKSLTQTYETQIMMVVTQVMMLDILKKQDTHYDGVMGFSLGEMTAIYAAGVIDYKHLIKLTAARAKAMQKACDDVSGTMAAVMKLPVKSIKDTCDALSSEDAFMMPVNFNAPLQTVISGHKSLLNDISVAIKAQGGRVIPLRVAGAFHTPLMKAFKHIYEKELRKVSFQKPLKTFVSNVTGHVLHDHFADMMLKQMSSPVLFTTMLQHIVEQRYEQVIEIGPGRVLSGLVSKQVENIRIRTIHNASALEDKI